MSTAAPAPVHGNTGCRIKNLKTTSGCKHYSQYAASSLSETKCAVNGCDGNAIRACHVISVNQTSISGIRKLVYMCPTHNGTYETHSIRLNAKTVILEHCDCGVDA